MQVRLYCIVSMDKTLIGLSLYTFEWLVRLMVVTGGSLTRRPQKSLRQISKQMNKTAETVGIYNLIK